MNKSNRITGRLFFFNPDCELAIADGGMYYMPPANIRKMEADLAFLPAWIAGEGDCVLVKELPDTDFLKHVVEPLNLSVVAVSEPMLGRYDGLRGEPWGRSPRVCHWLAGKGLGEEWKAWQKEWYSRKMAREGLRRLLQMIPGLDSRLLPCICHSIEDLERSIEEGCYLVKAPWSSSGKGLLTLSRPVGTKEKEWLRGMFRKQGYLMLERKWNKVKDFAMEFHAAPTGITFIGWSDFVAGEKGEYRGNYLGAQENIVQRLLLYMDKELLLSLKTKMIEMLQGLLPFYCGYFGVDMMIWRDEKGNYRLHPCVEINLRYNMGIVALSLSQRYLAEGVWGKFEIRYFPGEGAAWEEHLRLQRQYPVRYKNNRIESGYLNLAPVNEATNFIASVVCY